MNHAQDLRELSRSLLQDGRTREADECDEAAAELERLQQTQGRRMSEKHDLRIVAEASSDAWDTAPESHRPILRDCSDALLQAATELERLHPRTTGDILMPSNGGPAFLPVSLRDYFAAAAMQGILASFDVTSRRRAEVEPEIMHRIAPAAYLLADAMLAERERGGAK